MSDFLQQVTAAFAPAIAGGQLGIESSAYDEQAFGNALVVLAGANLRVRVIRDRDETFADVASRLDPENWFPLQRAIRAVGISSAPPEGLLPPATAAQLVERYFQDLNAGFAQERWGNTKCELEALGRAAKERMMARVHGR
ncbi:MAG: hypothetical protein ACT4UQ_10210 [Gammaproteobacteria bacterium]